MTGEVTQSNEATKQCPFCAEEILEAAIRCKHCQADLTTDATRAAERKNVGEGLGIALLLLPLASTALIWFWVANMNLPQGPSSSLTGILVVTIVVTAIIAAAEASQLGIGSESDKDENGGGRSGPLVWAMFHLLLWAIAYPVYLFWRSKYGAKNLIVGGTLVALVFIGSFAVMSHAITVKTEEVRETLASTRPTRENMPSSEPEPAPVVTLDSYGRLASGMSYEKVREIIGNPGRELSSSSIAGYKTVMYSWSNHDGSNMNAMFQNGKLTQKAQFGLK